MDGQRVVEKFIQKAVLFKLRKVGIYKIQKLFIALLHGDGVEGLIAEPVKRDLGFIIYDRIRPSDEVIVGVHGVFRLFKGAIALRRTRAKFQIFSKALFCQKVVNGRVFYDENFSSVKLA